MVPMLDEENVQIGTDSKALLGEIHRQSSDLINYAASASTATSNTPAKQVAGGVAASIPLADALVPSTGASPTGAGGGGGAAGLSTRPQATYTVTAGGGVATATVTGAPTLLGGGTATAFATVVVGPGGIIAATTRGGNGTMSGVAGATGQPMAPVPFTGGAGGRKMDEVTSVLVMAGMVALGTMVLDARR